MSRPLRRFVLAALGASLLLAASLAAAQTTPDPVDLQLVSAGHGKIRLTVTAGPSGAPEGFQIRWLNSAQFASQARVWPASLATVDGWADFTGTGTLNTWGAPAVDFRLGPNESIDIEIGDTFDESGVSGTTDEELVEGTSYVISAVALGGGAGNSPLSLTLEQSTSVQGFNCTYTVGYWKTHPAAWPAGALTLGTVTYSQSQLLAILNQPVRGNGLVSLAHQLIAAKLNVAAGASVSAASTAIASADALIGGLVVPSVGSGYVAPSSASAWTQSLDDYNNGVVGPGHCGAVPARIRTWGELKSTYR